MFRYGDLEERFRAALPEIDEVDRKDVAFAVDFALLLAQILTDRDHTPGVRFAMRSAIKVRTNLSDRGIETLLDLALAPEQRVAIDEDQLRAFGSHFGSAEGEALRLAAGREVDLRRFASRYGEAEALKLLDSLFFVFAVDGRIDSDEIRRLDRAARRLEIDQALINALFRKYDVRHNEGEVITLDRSRYIIGRAPHHDINLPDPQIALRHAELVKTGQGWQVADLNSGRPTVVNGHPVRQARLGAGDELRIGTTTLRFQADDQIRIRGTASFSSLSVRNLRRTVEGDVTLIDDVSFTVFTGEVIAIVGPSGSGKTTLVNAIAGIVPADEGEVLYGAHPFHRMVELDPSVMGNVPQDDVLHRDLTVEECLRFAGRLRLGRRARRSAIEGAVDRVADELELDGIRRNLIGSEISGGQRKRVNVGQELLSRSNRVLILDEPTSGLDPQTSQGIVGLVRQLANDGRIVFVVTHDVTPSILSMVDHLLVVARGGRLAWFGPPAEARTYFGVRSADQIFAKLTERPDEEWAARYRAHSAFRTYVRTREHLVDLDGLEIHAEGDTRPVLRSTWRDLRTLTGRYAKVKLRDTSGLLVLLSQAPVLGLFLWVVFPRPDAGAIFMIALSCLWFGLSAAVRELIVDRAIAQREAMVGVPAAAYLGSKVVVLSLIVTLQCSFLATLGYFLLPLNGDYGYSLPALCAVTSLTGFVGVATGLWVSARMRTSEGAVGTLPLILIPQIVFSGLLVRVKEMGPVADALSSLMIVRYAFEATMKTGQRLTEYANSRTGRVERDLPGMLHSLGFRSADPDDFGIPMEWLIVILGAVAVGLLLSTNRRLARILTAAR